ncbi:MAG: RNA polymerase sigma factor [bacterium]|nr:RNA polymerase sigma factor [bacterium]
MNPDHHRHEDLELAHAAAAGDTMAWRRIYDDTCQPLFNFLCYQTGDRDAARDLLQETYTTACVRLGDYRGDGSLLGWLRAVALRKCLDWRRRVARRLNKLAAYAREAAGTSAAPASVGIGDGFQSALDQLSSRQRAALLLRELEDQSFAQIADALGCSEATARVHHHRARAAMRLRLSGETELALGDNAGGTP